MSWPPAVLIIDDEPLIHEICLAALSDEGIPAAAVATTDDALVYLETHQASAILLDTYGTVGNGARFVQRYRERAGPHAAIYVFSAALDAKDHVVGIGADGYLAKPFDLEELLALVRRSRP